MNKAQLIATNCLCCGRTLTDAVSVETGIGPICRGKYLQAALGISEQERHAANKLVHSAALGTTSNAKRLHIADKLEALGFVQLALIVRKRFGLKALVLRPLESCDFSSGEAPGFLLSMPYSPKIHAFNSHFKKNVPAAHRKPMFRKNKSGKSVFMGWAFKSSPLLKRRVLDALTAVYAGEEIAGPRGTFFA